MVRPVAALALAALLLAPALAAEPQAPAPPSPQAGQPLSALDVSFALARLARGESPLSVLAPFQGAQAKLSIPSALMAPVLSPPPLETTLRALQRANAGDGLDEAGVLATLQDHPLPPDLARALSGLGQAALGAQALAAGGDAYAGAALVQAALDAYRGTFEKRTILLSYPAAYSRLAWDETGTRASLASAIAARTPEDALAAAGLRAAPLLGAPPALSAELAALAVKLELPVDAPTRAAWAVADGLPEGTRAPLQAALQHAMRAMDLREQAVRALTPADIALLQEPALVADAALAPDPTPAQLALLVRYGEAVSRLDEPAMLSGADELLAARDALMSAPAPSEDEGLGMGSLATSVDPSSGDLVVRLGDSGPGLDLPGGIPSFDPKTGSLTVRDASGATLLQTPAVADPGNNVLFQDPYGLVVVSGRGTTYTDASFGGREVVAEWPGAPQADPAESADALLSSVDAALAKAPDGGAWPYLSAQGHAALAPFQGQGAPTRARLLVNPAGYQVLRWDLGGDDAYLTNAGGAGTRGLLALEGDGATGLAKDLLPRPLPVALLVDDGGNDRYVTSEDATIAAANGTLALLADLGGRDRFDLQGAHRGIASASAGGVALLLHGAGDATFRGQADSVSRADADGTALLVAAGGNDTYSGGDRSLGASILGREAGLVDLGGDDRYQAANLSLGASTGGIGLLLDAAGNDTYVDAAATAQGYAAPEADAAPARIAVLADLGGNDAGACGAGRLSNAMLGSANVGRSPFDPAFGVCADLRLAPAPAGTEVPPTFFASSFGNFTLPGLARVGTLGDDVVPGPYVLDVDVMGNDTYGVGAVAVANASRAAKLSMDLGYVGPVSILLDTDGNNLFDAALGQAGDEAGRFGFADGGVAVQATIWSRAAEPTDPSGDLDALGASLARAGDNASAARDALLAGGAPAQALLNVTQQQPSIPPPLEHPSGTNAYLHVHEGLGAARDLGAALVLSEGYATRVDAAPDPRTSCRLACAATGGSALVLSQGGPGDDVTASPGSLGAATPGELGALAVYLHRGGTDRYRGSNESMGALSPVAPSSGERPTVALFVKDGWADDGYDANMTAPGLLREPRGNDAAWQDAALEDAFSEPGGRSLRVAQGVDNLDWYLNANLKRADEGVAPGVGPDDPLAPHEAPLDASSTGPAGETVGEAARAGGYAAGDAAYAALSAAGLGKGFGEPARRLVDQQADAAANDVEHPQEGGGGSASTPDERDQGQAVDDPGSGGSLTGPQGAQPVTLARTAFSPIVHLAAVANPDAESRYAPPHSYASLGETIGFRLDVQAPPAFAESAASPADAIARIELSVRGTGPSWQGCPDPALRDPLDPQACLVVQWNRTDTTPQPHVRRYGASATGWQVDWSASGYVPGSARPLIPPGPYALTFRAFAERPYGEPAAPFGVRDGLLDATLSDAFNYTDDSYGLYGGSSSLAVLLYNTPVIGDSIAVVSSNGAAPATFSAPVTEPCNVTVNVTDDSGSLVPGGSFQVATSFADDPASLARVGFDYVNFTWHGETLPRGRYQFHVHWVGRVSGKAPSPSNDKTPYVWVDDRAPAVSQDPRGTPVRVNASEAPGGRFPVPVLYDPDEASGHGAPVDRIHLWYQEDVLDPADPHRVLERHNWTYAGAATDIGATFANPLPGGGRADWYAPRFPGDPRPGPPRVYRIAAYAEDNAGNVKVADPSTTPPSGPDCVAGRCAVYYYDITPPRTRLALLDPSPELARAAGGPIVLRADAPETPDVARIDVLALPVPPGRDALLQASAVQADPAPAAGPAKPNLTLSAPDEGLALAGPQGLVEAGAPLHLRLKVTNREKGGAFGVDDLTDLSRPVWVRLDLLNDSGAPAMEPVWINATARAGNLVAGGNQTLALDLPAPPAPGLYVLRAGVDLDLTDPNATALPFQAAFAAWTRAPSAGDGTYGYQPDNLTDNESLLFLARGVDLVGNVEEKADYDARVDVDLTPPALAGPAAVDASSTTAVVRFSTTEPASATVEATDDGGNLTQAADDDVALDHEVRLEGLTPGASHRLTLRLVDAVGNAANVSAGPFRTADFVDVRAAALPPLVARPMDVAWNVSARDAEQVVYDVSLSLDGGRTYVANLTGAGLPAYESGNSTHSARLDPATLPESPRARLRVCARPADGGEARACDVTPLFTLDGVAPRTLINASANLSSYQRGPVDLRLSALDNGSGVAAVEWSRDNATFQPASDPVRVAGDAPVDVFVRARDNAGNAEPAQRVRVLLDGQAPALSAELPGGALAGAATVPVLVRASDGLSGVARVDAVADDGFRASLLPRDLVGGVGRLAWSLGGAEGPRWLLVSARDAAGNVAQSNVTLRVDRTPPRLLEGALRAGLTSASADLSWSEPVSVSALLATPEGAIPLDASPALVRADALRPGTAYALVLAARDAAGNLGEARLDFRTLPDFTPPPAPATMGATAEPDGTVALRWAPVADEGGAVVYRVLRGENGSWAPLRTTASPFALDDEAVAGHAYDYRVAAVDGAGNVGPVSPTASVTAREAVKVLAREARVVDGRIEVRVLFSADPGAPAQVVAEGRSFPLAPQGEALYAATLDLGPATLARDPGYHVEAGALRDPPVGEARLPLVAGAPHGRGLAGALRAVPAPAPWLALLAAAALMGRRRR